MLKSDDKKNLIMIEENSNNIINVDIIEYWHKDLQLTVNDENILLYPLRMVE